MALRSGWPLAELERWSYPKFKIRIGLIEEAMLQAALLQVQAESEPKTLLKRLDELRKTHAPAREPEWEKPSLERLRKRMEDGGERSAGF